jgi:hypothetical protein
MKTAPRMRTGEGKATTVGQLLVEAVCNGASDAARQGISYAITAAFRLLALTVSDH